MPRYSQTWDDHQPTRRKLICFDLDGVLLDSRTNMETAWSAVRRELQVTVPFETYFGEIGRPFGEIMQRIGLGGSAEAVEAVFRRASQETIATTPFYPGVEAMLDALSNEGMKLAIVTSKDRARTELALARLTVSFESVQTPDAVCRGKPAPDHLLMAMATCNVDPSESLYVGDMDPDAEAARRAGIDYIHAAWGYGREPVSAIASVRDCGALADYLLNQEKDILSA